MTAGSTTLEEEVLPPGSSGGGRRSLGVAETAEMAGVALGAKGVPRIGTLSLDGRRGVDQIASSGPGGARSNVLNVDAGPASSLPEFASADVSSADALLPGRVFSVSNAATASGPPSGSGSGAAGFFTEINASSVRCQRLGQGAPGTFASPPGPAQALRVAPTMVGGGLNFDAAGGTESEPRAGGLGGGAFILEAEGPRPLAAVVGRPPEGMKRCAPDSQGGASPSTLPTPPLGPRVGTSCFRRSGIRHETTRLPADC